MKPFYFVVFILVFNGCDNIKDFVGLSESEDKVNVENIYSNVPILYKTGQSQSFDQSANEVNDDSSHDDGYYQSGEVRTLTRDDLNEIVYDSKTELMWLDNIKPERFTIEYCSELVNAGYDDWRLPSVEELLTIVDFERTDVTVDRIFINIKNDNYLTSTRELDALVAHVNNDTHDAYIIRFNYGSISKLSANNLICVRSDIDKYDTEINELYEMGFIED